MKKAISVITVLFLLLSLASCSADVSGGKDAGSSAQNVSTREGWPKDVPSCLPVFTYGVYQSDYTTRIETKGIVTYMLRFTGVSKDDMKAYEEALKKTTLTVNVTEAQDMYAVGAGKDIDGYYIAPVSAYLEETVNTCSITVIVYAKYPEY